tara:strand:+ start:32 stop:1201 length:1170 start_codon:yes stop_codon:yes gene_type:complete
MSQTKAQLLEGTAAQNVTVDNINTTSVNSGQVSGRKNLVINGAMQVAQRGTSSTSNGYHTIDRFQTVNSSNDETPSQAQVDVASGTTPYTLGFRKAFKLTNGNQTGGAAAAAVAGIRYAVEAQDIAQSGWNFKSASSFITLSFWVKSSVAQNFHAYLLTLDGTLRIFPFETGSLTADTWTKVTKTIPGSSLLDITNDNGEGFRIEWRAFSGTGQTDSGVSLDTWATFASGTRTPDDTSTWYTTNDATFEITGVQLEVGSTATDFEHRSFAEELKLCQRYFYTANRWMGGSRGSSTSRSFILNFGMRLTGTDVSSGTYTNNETSGGDVVYIGSSATRQESTVTANSLGASSTSTAGSMQVGVTVGYGIGSGDNGIATGLYINGFSISHEL